MRQVQRFSRIALARQVIFIGMLLLTLSACTRGAKTKEEVVNTYLQALEDRNERAILALIPENYVAEQAVQAKIAQLGGHDFRDLQVCYREVIKPQLIDVKIQGAYLGVKGKEIKFKDSLNLQFMGGSHVGDRYTWQLTSLGQLRHPPNYGPPTTPVPKSQVKQ